MFSFYLRVYLFFKQLTGSLCLWFPLDTKALNKRLYQCVTGQLTQSHTDDRGYETYFYILTYCVQLFLL